MEFKGPRGRSLVEGRDAREVGVDELQAGDAPVPLPETVTLAPARGRMAASTTTPTMLPACGAKSDGGTGAGPDSAHPARGPAKSPAPTIAMRRACPGSTAPTPAGCR